MFPKAAIAIFILLPAGWAAAQSADPTAAEHKRELAYNLYAKQQYGEALKVIEKHFPDPNDELISTTRFQCLIGLGRFAEALKIIEHEVSTKGTTELLSVYYLVTLTKAGKPKAAVEHALRVVNNMNYSSRDSALVPIILCELLLVHASQDIPQIQAKDIERLARKAAQHAGPEHNASILSILAALKAQKGDFESAQTIEKLALKASQESRRQYHSKRLKQYEQGKRYTSENSFFETTQFPMAEVDHIALPRTPKVPLAK